jgi:hypothetical protein
MYCRHDRGLQAAAGHPVPELLDFMRQEGWRPFCIDTGGHGLVPARNASHQEPHCYDVVFKSPHHRLERRPFR